MDHKAYFCNGMAAEPFVLLGLGFWLILLIVAFRLLDRYQKKRPPWTVITVLLHSNCIAILVLCNMGLTTLLYQPILELFDINTSGFINLNGIFTACIIWSILCLLFWVIVGKAKEQLGRYYRTLRTSLMIFALLPLFLCFLFLFLAGLN